MLLTEFATGKPHFQNDFAALRVSYYFHGRFSSVSFAFGYEQRFSPAWKYSKSKKLNFNLGQVELHRRAIPIMAVATLEPKPLITDEDGFMDPTNSEPESYSELPASDIECTKSTELDNREKLRRMKISKANKGNTPWNKGRKHSPETLKRIKERTWLAMQDPKVKMKLANLGHAQSEETRIKIGLGVRMRCERRRRMKMVQESCCLEWQNLIAEAARHGYTGEKELQWDSYKMLDVKLRQEWLESMEQQTKVPDGRRAPKSLEQRRKIAEAIAAKWAEPDYRERVCCSLAKHHSIPPGVERKPRRSPRYGPRNIKALEEKFFSEIETKAPKKPPLRKRNSTPYKDPLVGSKLEMIKNLRARRAASETKHIQAIERARSLIAEAEKAAKALEVAATNSRVAQASLIETRKLIAQAVQSIKSIEARQVTEPTVRSDSVHNEVITSENKRQEAGIAFEDEKQSNQTQINGNSDLASNTQHDSLNFGGFDLGEILQATSSLGYSFSISHGLNGQKKDLDQGAISQLMQPGAEASSKNMELLPSANEVEIHSHTEAAATKSRRVIKKWVRGRLVVVAEAA